MPDPDKPAPAGLWPGASRIGLLFTGFLPFRLCHNYVPITTE